MLKIFQVLGWILIGHLNRPFESEPWGDPFEVLKMGKQRKVLVWFLQVVNIFPFFCQSIELESSIKLKHLANFL